MLKEHSEMARRVRQIIHRGWDISEDVVNLFKEQIDKLTVIDKGSWFWHNCQQQRRKPAKICLECPFIDCKTGELKLKKQLFDLMGE